MHSGTNDFFQGVIENSHSDFLKTVQKGLTETYISHAWQTDNIIVHV